MEKHLKRGGSVGEDCVIVRTCPSLAPHDLPVTKATHEGGMGPQKAVSESQPRVQAITESSFPFCQMSPWLVGVDHASFHWVVVVY